MRLGQTSAVYFVSKILGSFLGFIATVYFARVLGEVVLGYYALVLALVAWLGLVGRAGITQAVVKRVSEGKDPARYVTAGSLMIGGIFCVIAVCVLVFRDLVNGYVGAPVAEFVVLLLCVELYRTFSFAALRGNHLVHVYAPLTTLDSGMRSIAQISLVVVGWGLIGMLVGYAISGLIVGVLALWVLKFRPRLPEKHHFRRLLDFAKFSWLGNLRVRTFNSLDVLVLGVFVSAGLVGVYAVAWSIGKFLDIFGSGIQTSLFPELSKLAKEGDQTAVAKLVEDALTYAGLVLVPGLVGAATVGDRLLLLYGDGFVVGETVLVILIAALLVYTYTKQLISTLDAMDRPDLAFRANGAFILANVVGNVVLVALYGWIGAAVATGLSAGVGLVLAYRYLQQLVSFSIPVGEIGRQWIAAGFMGATVLVAREFGEPTALATYNEVFVVVLAGAGAGVYFLTLCGISGQFRQTIVQNLPFEVPVVSR